MKKLLFAAQVFGLIAMLPVVVMLEMNHVSAQRYPAPVSAAQKANSMSVLTEKAVNRLSFDAFSVIVVTFLF